MAVWLYVSPESTGDTSHFCCNHFSFLYYLIGVSKYVGKIFLVRGNARASD
jgi:hypothetical protein